MRKDNKIGHPYLKRFETEIIDELKIDRKSDVSIIGSVRINGKTYGFCFLLQDNAFLIQVSLSDNSFKYLQNILIVLSTVL